MPATGRFCLDSHPPGRVIPCPLATHISLEHCIDRGTNECRCRRCRRLRPSCILFGIADLCHIVQHCSKARRTNQGWILLDHPPDRNLSADTTKRFSCASMCCTHAHMCTHTHTHTRTHAHTHMHMRTHTNMQGDLRDGSADASVLSCSTAGVEVDCACEPSAAEALATPSLQPPPGRRRGITKGVDVRNLLGKAATSGVGALQQKGFVFLNLSLGVCCKEL
jgi:hypothetical protein